MPFHDQIRNPTTAALPDDNDDENYLSFDQRLNVAVLNVKCGVFDALSINIDYLWNIFNISKYNKRMSYHTFRVAFQAEHNQPTN